MTPTYLETARLLTQVAPLIFPNNLFALKGGTAINLFLRDMPRLSVDLDLVFLNHTLPRAEALAVINVAMLQVAERLRRRGFETQAPASQKTCETKLFVRRGSIAVKVEVNYVMRGTVHPVRPMPLSQRARDALLADLEIPLLAAEDIYGGKLVAALDRQHPRDLFDVRELLAHEGITPGIRRAFLVYLVSHNRPIHEVLFPTLRDIRMDYESGFKGMTAKPVSLDELTSVRKQMIREIQSSLDMNERQFLLSMVTGEPNWELLDIPHLRELPGVRWKLHNLKQLCQDSPKKFHQQAEQLTRLLHA